MGNYYIFDLTNVCIRIGILKHVNSIIISKLSTKYNKSVKILSCLNYMLYFDYNILSLTELKIVKTQKFYKFKVYAP